MLKIDLPTELVLTRVISGGQIGADRAGLEAACRAKLSTGGTAPLNYRTQNGDDPMLGSLYGLVQDSHYGYKPRTIKNVVDSDGTIIIAKNLHSPGCLLTSKTCAIKKKPVLGILIPDRPPTGEEIVHYRNKVRQFLIEKQIHTLNVAGNRDHLGGISLYEVIIEILTPIFEEAHVKKL